MFAIYKKELKSYFLSPIGYICIGIKIPSSKGENENEET